MGTLSNNSKIGDKGKDLVLQTLGRVYVQVKDRFYEVQFRGEDPKEEEEKKETPLVIFIDSEEALEGYPYPGDDYLIITADGKFFQTDNTTYTPIPLSAISSTKFSEALTIDTITTPFIITSSQLVKNLNAEFLNGVSSSNYARKDISEDIPNEWRFNSLVSKKITDKNLYTQLDLERGVLSIDTINANNINIPSRPNNPIEKDVAYSSIDIINKPTYCGNGLKVLKVEVINKIVYYSNKNLIWYSNNENAEVGGYSISNLIDIAYNEELLNITNSLFYYYNLLTTAFKYNEISGKWDDYTITELDFKPSGDSKVLIYLSLKFMPKDRSIYETIQYGTRYNCATHIYDRWFNILEYTGTIKDKYRGITFECTTEITQLHAGVKLYGTGDKGIVEGLVVGCTDTKVRILTSGVDCKFLYMTDESTGVEDLIKACALEQNVEKGKTISADIEIGNILFDVESNNIIGNISNIVNSVFGTLSGYGLTSEGNCFFVNPGIALVNSDGFNYLKLGNHKDSFIGINSISGTPWITINEYGIGNMTGIGVKDTITYAFNSIDGSASIGSSEYRITVDSNGVVKIPQKCIVPNP